MRRDGRPVFRCLLLFVSGRDRALVNPFAKHRHLARSERRLLVRHPRDLVVRIRQHADQQTLRASARFERRLMLALTCERRGVEPKP